MMTYPAVVIDYTNHRGERSERKISPQAIYWDENSQWHAPGWVLRAFCHDRGTIREFALRDIHSWKDTPDQEAR